MPTPGNEDPFFGNQETNGVEIGSRQLFILFFPARVELKNGGLEEDALLRPLRSGRRVEILPAALIALSKFSSGDQLRVSYQDSVGLEFRSLRSPGSGGLEWLWRR